MDVEHLNRELANEFVGQEESLAADRVKITSTMQEGLALAYEIDGFKQYLEATVSNAAYLMATESKTTEDLVFLKARILDRKKLINKMREAADKVLKNTKQ
jgi:hypothetical protein